VEVKLSVHDEFLELPSIQMYILLVPFVHYVIFVKICRKMMIVFFFYEISVFAFYLLLVELRVTILMQMAIQS